MYIVHHRVRPIICILPISDETVGAKGVNPLGDGKESGTFYWELTLEQAFLSDS